ncbi:transposase [Melioribacteraceae bacterium 4301-Me]|uniref:transposase n=1 Tax=Pyranulibacter aquaticus TaxID=3163344 RepID=UPI0035990D47
MKHERKRTRLIDYDYSSPHYYFVTICTKNKKNLFGDVINSKVVLNKNGIVVKELWLRIVEHFTNVELDEYILMPNHFHGIIIIYDKVGLRSPQTEIKTKNFSLSQIIAYFKYQTTKRINLIEGVEGRVIWQRSFYDRIIRNEKELEKIRHYIHYNAIKWDEDKGDGNLEI